MAKKKEAPLAGVELRLRTKEQLAAGQGTASATSGEPLKLLHELQVHQVELELQNAELQQARNETATLLEQYTDLYDFAPVGYFTLDRSGIVCSSNLTGADLLGVVRSRLNGRRFSQFLTVADRPVFATFLDQIFLDPANATCEAALLATENSPRFMQIQAVAATSGERCRLVVIDITERKQMEERLRERNREIEELKRRLEHENVYLQEEIKGLVGYGAIISNSTAMRGVIFQAKQVAGTGSTVLIFGETGTGKELLARAIHDLSPRKGRPLITVNCASLPPTLIEAELFGREKGAYTGALSRVTGRFELADGSSIFLDEIGELPFELQAKLLRVIEDGIFQRLGSSLPIKANLRIIAATNRNLFEEVQSGRFRSDLYYRLNVFPITIPPLRERLEDIPPLVWSLVKEFEETMGKKIDRITDKTMTVLTSYHWPGNVRELRNVIERAMILSTRTSLEVYLPEIATVPKKPHGKALRDVEREQILMVLAETKWKIGGKGGAAEILELERTTLHAKMKKLDISRHG